MLTHADLYGLLVQTHADTDETQKLTQKLTQQSCKVFSIAWRQISLTTSV